MRTFILLTAILLVTLQAKAEPVPPTDDEALDQERSEAEDQFMTFSVSIDKERVLQDPGQNIPYKCKCRDWCKPHESHAGICWNGPFKKGRFCCVD